MSRRKTYDDGTVRRSSRSSWGSPNKPPRFILARTEEEVEAFCKQNHISRDKITWLQTVDQIRNLPATQRFRLQRTGTWYLGDPDDLSEIEEELKFRKEHIG